MQVSNPSTVSTIGRTFPAYKDSDEQVQRSADNLPTVNDHEEDNLADLAAVRDRLRAEANRLDSLILRLMTAEAATKRELTRFDFGEQLGATKLARVLGCSRTHAYKLMEIELASAVRSDGNGRQWVPRAAVDAWLTQQDGAAA